MDKKRQKSLASTVRDGVIAGIVGTAAMDLLWYRRYRRDGGEDALFDWEFSAGTTDYESAGAPAQTGKRIVEGALRTELEPRTARTMNNAVHWATGIGWGALHALASRSTERKPQVTHGLGLGATAWAASYATLAPLGVYEPIWKYPISVLGKDLSAHLVYGLGAGTTALALTQRSGA